MSERVKESMVGHLACFVAYAIFGLNIIVCKDLTSSDTISPLALFCLRSIGAGLIFWLISLFLPNEKVERRDYIKIFAASYNRKNEMSIFQKRNEQIFSFFASFFLWLFRPLKHQLNAD